MSAELTALEMIRQQRKLTEKGIPLAAKPILRQLLQPHANGLTTLATSTDIREAAADIHPEPSHAQREAGNHSCGHFLWQGLNITLEVAKNGFRRGIGKDGVEWARKVPHYYGYIRRVSGEATKRSGDGEHADVWVGPHLDSELVSVINQCKPDGTFDECKAMLGFRNKREAKEGYLACYPSGWRGCGSIVEMTLPQFKLWLKTGDLTQSLEESHLLAGIPRASGPVTLSTFNPKDHPRGQPDNAGEFAKKKSANRDRVASPEFKQWFGNSKVSTKDGKPLRVFHGTDREFQEFRPLSHFGTYPAAEHIITIPVSSEWEDLSPDDYRGGQFIEEPKIYPVFLSIQNPFRIRDKRGQHTADDIINAVRAAGGMTKKEWQDVNSVSDLIKFMEGKGYDGLVYENETEDVGNDSWVIFHPEQVKSASGNNGEFDATKPSITLSTRPVASKPERPPTPNAILIAYLDALVNAENGDPHADQVADYLWQMLGGKGHHPENAQEVAA